MPSRARLQSWLLPYAFAVVSAATATAVASMLAQAMGRRAAGPLVTCAYVIGLLVPAWRGGYGPGLLSLATLTLASPHILAGGWVPRAAEWPRLGASVLLSLSVSYMASRRKRGEAELRAINDDLERRVRERTAELSSVNAELRALATELQRSNERLQQTNEELERFAYIASHDLQEPLRTMSMYTQLLRRTYGGKLGEDADEMLDYILRGSRRMQELVGAVMELSRGTSPVPNFERTSANDALAVAKASLATVIADHQAEIEADDLPSVDGDLTHLSRVFQNLISNAVRFRGAAPPRIRVAATAEGDAWVFSVADNGIGIALEHRQRIFELFARLHPWSKMPGAGIGLAVCKRIVEHHGGRIWLDSEVGRGSTFYFSLPRHMQRSIPASGGLEASLQKSAGAFD